jgi:hypothetical protein
MSTVNGPLIQWLINGSDTRIDWSKPTLEYVQNGNYMLKEYQVVYLKRGISQRRGHQSKHCSDT